MKIVESKVIQVAVDQKIKEDLRDQVRRACTKYVSGGNQWVKIAGMQVAAELAKSGPDHLFAMTQGTIFLFSLEHQTEDQWVVTIDSLKAPVSPRKTLVKMVELRIRRVHKDRQDRINSKTVGDLTPPPDFTTRQTIFEYEAPSSFRSAVTDLQKIITRHEIQDDIILEAWHLSIARHIMES